MPPTKSPVWKYFLKIQTGGKCKLCNLDVKSPGTTTNLLQHLKRRHPKMNITLKGAKESAEEGSESVSI